MSAYADRWSEVASSYAGPDTVIATRLHMFWASRCSGAASRTASSPRAIGPLREPAVGPLELLHGLEGRVPLGLVTGIKLVGSLTNPTTGLKQGKRSVSHRWETSPNASFIHSLPSRQIFGFISLHWSDRLHNGLMNSIGHTSSALQPRGLRRGSMSARQIPPRRQTAQICHSEASSKALLEWMRHRGAPEQAGVSHWSETSSSFSFRRSESVSPNPISNVVQHQ